MSDLLDDNVAQTAVFGHSFGIPFTGSQNCFQLTANLLQLFGLFLCPPPL
jgi:hypothetical protein